MALYIGISNNITEQPLATLRKKPSGENDDV